MYEVIMPKHVFKELSSTNKKDQQLIFDKIKELEKAILQTTSHSRANTKASLEK